MLSYLEDEAKGTRGPLPDSAGKALLLRDCLGDEVYNVVDGDKDDGDELVDGDKGLAFEPGPLCL